MKRFSITCISTMILLGGIWYTDSINANELPATTCNVSCMNQWGSEITYVVAYDGLRNLVFAGCREHICMLDVSNPNVPLIISDFELSALTLCGIQYDEISSRLYLLLGGEGFEIWDITQSKMPSKISSYDTKGYTCGLAINDPYVYVADADAGLQVIDVSDPSSPTDITALDMTCATSVTISGHYVYVTDLGLRILDISKPNRPEEISYLETPGVSRDVHVEGHYAYVADDWKGIRVIDISDKTRPYEVGNIITSGYAWDIDLAGSNLYVAACGGGLKVIDVLDPTKPYEITVTTPSREALGVAVAGQHAYVAQATSGLGIYSSEPTRGNSSSIKSPSDLAACR